MRRLIPLIATSVALVAAPAATAHSSELVRGHVSTLTAVEPATPGLEISILDSDDRLVLENDTGKTVVVLGYSGEPYLRFDAQGVFRNLRSPASYLNAERFPPQELPATADPQAEPTWEKLADGKRYEWHDHRIHWVETTAPAQIRALPDAEHHLFDWSVPLEVDGGPVAAAGRLDYAPPPPEASSSHMLTLAVVIGVTAAVIGLLALLMLRARTRDSRVRDREELSA